MRLSQGVLYTVSMSWSLTVRLLVIGMGAAVSPVAVMVLISLMLRKHPLKNALFFLLGFTPTLVALGIVAVTLMHAGGSGKKSAVDAYIDLALGALCLLAIIPVIRKKPKESEPEPEDLKASRSLAIGCLTMLVNYSTLVIYASGIHYISSARLSLPENVFYMALLTVVTLSTLLLPVAVYIAVPGRAERWLAALKEWLGEHNKQIGVAILLIFAVLLFVKGARLL